MNDITVKINPIDFGLEESKAKQIQEQFQPMLDKMVELEKEANDVFKMPVQKAAAKAKEVRLKYVKVRTGTAAIHKEQKAFYLQAGKFIDGWKNAQVFASQGIEERLMQIERYEEIQRQQRVEKLQAERAVQLEEFELVVIPENLGSMSDEVWNNFFLGTKTNYKAKKEAERKAEHERIEEQARKDLHDERYQGLMLLWDFLPKEIPGDLSVLRHDEFYLLLNDAKKAKSDHEAEQERIRKENVRLQKEKEVAEKKAEIERKAREAQLKKEREQYEAKLRKQQEEANRLKTELKAKEEAEAKAKAEEEVRQEADAKKGDAAKIKDLQADIKSIKTKYQFRSKANIEKFAEAQKYLDYALTIIQSEKQLA